MAKITSTKNLVDPFTPCLKRLSSLTRGNGCQMYTKLDLRASKRLLGFMP
jgi:hypothetical protein